MLPQQEVVPCFGVDSEGGCEVGCEGEQLFKEGLNGWGYCGVAPEVGGEVQLIGVGGGTEVAMIGAEDFDSRCVVWVGAWDGLQAFYFQQEQGCWGCIGAGVVDYSDFSVVVD